jgi:hypothetical protein
MVSREEIGNRRSPDADRAVAEKLPGPRVQTNDELFEYARQGGNKP